MTHNFKKPPIIYHGKTDLIKQLPCIMPGTWEHTCSEGTDPAHLTTGMYAGTNLKNDRRILPLCRTHHSIQHGMPERSFWGIKFVDAMVLADLLHILYLEIIYMKQGEFNDMYEACERFAI